LSTSSVGSALESEIFGIDHQLVGFSFLATEFPVSFFVDLVAVDHVALQDVVTVVSLSASGFVISWSGRE
jgi:hypothetical protein